MSEPNSSKAHTDAWAHNAKIGLILFVLYLALYGGFIGMAAFAPHAMATPVQVLSGINVAVVYGLGLILMAFVLAIVYMGLCRQEPPEQIHSATETEISAALSSEGTP